MSVAEKAKVTDLTAKSIKSHVKVTCYPDFARFKLENLENDHYSLFQRRCIDIAGVTNGKLKVSFNDTKIGLFSATVFFNFSFSNSEVFKTFTN